MTIYPLIQHRYGINRQAFGDTALIRGLGATKHKVFISYRHKTARTALLNFNHSDCDYKGQLEKLGEGIFINKSLENNEINPENKDKYIKRLIQENYISDSSVLIVLIGAETYTRKHIDWEISAALDYRVGNNYAGLIGVVLPTCPDYNDFPLNDEKYIPARLNDNIKSNYASFYRWDAFTKDKDTLAKYIEMAYKNREINKEKIINSGKQFVNNKGLGG